MIADKYVDNARRFYRYTKTVNLSAVEEFAKALNESKFVACFDRSSKIEILFSDSSAMYIPTK